MHQWGDEGVDWEGINDAAYFIATRLKRWGRIGVRDYKEKYGTVRVYCDLGLWSVYGIWRPSHCWVSKWWPYRLDTWLSNTLFWKLLNRLVIPYHVWLYRQTYLAAVRRWPHLYKEIVSMADYGELFEGVIPGYKHSDYWTTYK